MKVDFNLRIEPLVKGLSLLLLRKYWRARLLRNCRMTLRHRVPKSVGLRLCYRSLHDMVLDVKSFILWEQRHDLVLKLFLDGSGEGLSNRD